MNAEKKFGVVGLGAVLMVVGLLIASIGTVLFIRHNEALSIASLTTGIILWFVGGIIHNIENKYQTTKRGEKKQ